MRSWHHTQARRAYLERAGAGAVVQGYMAGRNRSSVGGILFRDENVKEIRLYPGSYSADDLKGIRTLFPEADIVDTSLTTNKSHTEAYQCQN
jgi:hypothetical protein